MSDLTADCSLYDEFSDQSLITRSVEGDKPAFEFLIRRHRGWLYRFVCRYVWNTEDAFDVLQETLAGAWLSLSRYDPTQDFDIWLRSIALNKCRDRARKNMVWCALFIPTSESMQIDEVLDPALTPEMTMEFKQAADAFHQAIANLPRTLKEPLILTMLEGLSQKESAELLQISVKAVETRVYRAKQKLAETLDQAQLKILLEKSG